MRNNGCWLLEQGILNYMLHRIIAEWVDFQSEIDNFNFLVAGCAQPNPLFVDYFQDIDVLRRCLTYT
jgi:hypothetical protein